MNDLSITKEELAAMKADFTRRLSEALTTKTFAEHGLRLIREVENLQADNERLACQCQQCGEMYREDVQLPDELWNRIKPAGKTEGAGLLCGACIGKKLAAEVEQLQAKVQYVVET